MKRFLVILSAILLASCSGRLDHSFLEDPAIRLTVNGDICLSYEETDCQLGFNAQNCSFCVMTDNASDYYILTMDRIPHSEGERINADITWTTVSSIENRKGIAFKVMKLEGDTIWLWNSDERIAVCVRTLI